MAFQLSSITGSSIPDPSIPGPLELLYDPATKTLTLEHLKTTGDSGAVQFDHGSTSGTIAVDFANGNVQAINLDGDCTLTFANLKNGYTYILAIKQDATGGLSLIHI